MNVIKMYKCKKLHIFHTDFNALYAEYIGYSHNSLEKMLKDTVNVLKKMCKKSIINMLIHFFVDEQRRNACKR